MLLEAGLSRFILIPGYLQLYLFHGDKLCAIVRVVKSMSSLCVLCVCVDFVGVARLGGTPWLLGRVTTGCHLWLVCYIKACWNVSIQHARYFHFFPPPSVFLSPSLSLPSTWLPDVLVLSHMFILGCYIVSRRAESAVTKMSQIGSLIYGTGFSVCSLWFVFCSIF